MSRKKITIGLFGFGCIGYGLYEVLQKTPGLKAGIKTICVKSRDKARPVEGNFTFDKNDILDDPGINVVVELIDDAKAAFDIVSTALKKGKAVVSANKKMIAENFEVLLELQQKYKAPLLYEAACCASIPIIRNLEEYYDNDLLVSIEGIVNGSTNYILTKTFAEGLSYKEALEEAQQNGYAESDPTLDTGGYDAKYKLQILAAHAFGLITKPEEVFHLGIDGLGQAEQNYAREKNRKIKLVAQAYRTREGRTACFVLPKFVRSDDRLYSVDDVYNGIATQTSFADRQFFVGRGAGAHPTASAVLSDISALSYDYRYEYKKINRQEQLEDDGNIFLEIFLRHEPAASGKWQRLFSVVRESWSGGSEAYTTGIVTLEALKQIAAEKKDGIVLVDAITDVEVWQPEWKEVAEATQ